jgi:2,5-diketo-D-gluconate reductase B
MLHRVIKKTAVPAIGLGTFGLSGAEGVRSVRTALDLGYRHLDTAQRYGNEAEIGEALATSSVRDDVFITTKVWHTDLAPERIATLSEESLRRLRRDFVDLLLVHWPNPAIPLEATLDAMLAVKAAGRARHIGVSNFPIHLLEVAWRCCGDALFANQVEYHPFLDQSKILEWLRARGMLLIAYMPLARGKVAEDPTLRAIANEHGKTPQQVALRWLVQQENVIPIPRSSRAENLSANIDIFGFDLSPSEMARIGALRGQGRLANPAWAPVWDSV